MTLGNVGVKGSFLGGKVKKFSSFLVSLVLLAGLSACSDPRAEFDALAAEAELSLDEGDYTLAQAYIDEALAILPDSPVGQEISSRIQAEAQSQAVLDTVKRQASSSSWEEALSSMEGLASDAARMEEAKASLQLNFQLRLVDYTFQSTEIESGELLLRTVPLLISAGIDLDEVLVEDAYELALEQTNLRLTEAVELDPEEAIEVLNVELAKELYQTEDLGELPQQITSIYELYIVDASKALVRNKDLSGAATLLTNAASKAPNSEAIETERSRVAELVRAEQAARKKAEEEAKKRAVSAMYRKDDSFNNMEWFYDRATYSQYAGNKFLLYIGQRSGNSPYLRMRFMLYRDNWHFFERIVLNVDGKKYEYEPGFQEIKRDNGGGDVWEWYDFNPSSRDLSMVRDIIDSTDTRIRYINDDNVYVEKTVSSAQKRAFANVVLAFEALGGRE